MGTCDCDLCGGHGRIRTELGQTVGCPACIRRKFNQAADAYADLHRRHLAIEQDLSAENAELRQRLAMTKQLGPNPEP